MDNRLGPARLDKSALAGGEPVFAQLPYTVTIADLPVGFGGGLPDATLLVENPYERLNADQLISVSVPVRRFAVRR